MQADYMLKKYKSHRAVLDFIFKNIELNKVQPLILARFTNHFLTNQN